MIKNQQIFVLENWFQMVCNYSVGLEKAEANFENSSKFFFLSMLLQAFPIVA